MKCDRRQRILTMIVLNCCLFVVELVVGTRSNSKTLVSDSFHMFSDMVALVIALVAIAISSRPWKRSTFGYARAEVLGALCNAVSLMSLCFTLLVDSVKKFVDPEPMTDPEIVLYVAVAGLLVNLFGMSLFAGIGHGHSHGHHHRGFGHGHRHHGEKLVHPDPRPDGKKAPIKPSLTEEKGPEIRGADKVRLERADPDGKTGSHVQREFRTYAVKILQDCSPAFAQVDDGGESSKEDRSRFQEVAASSGSDDHAKKALMEQAAPANQDDEQGIAVVQAGDAKAGVSGSRMNTRGVFLHLVADTLGSVVVIVSSTLYWKTDWEYKDYIDPLMTILSLTFIAMSTVPLLIESSYILLQTMPKALNVSHLQQQLFCGVGEIDTFHDFHIWQLSGSDEVVASLHVRLHSWVPEDEQMRVLKKMDGVLKSHGIHLTTIQIEHQSKVETLLPREICLSKHRP